MFRKHFKKDFSELNVYVYDFSVDYDTFPVDDILETYKYLMKKHDIK